MLLSIVVYKHTLRPAQWFGVVIVFFGLAIEAREKRREGLAKKVVAEKKAIVKDA
jgi:UDP-galactose transporter B1